MQAEPCAEVMTDGPLHPGALGLGFGATVMALNTLVEGFFPNSAEGAVLVLYALLGVGTALAAAGGRASVPSGHCRC